MDELTGELVVVATPIGNLGDLSPRARDVLERADLVCCEDTRRTRALLAAFELPAGRRLVSLHAHNETERAGAVADAVASGSVVAYVTDAGTPSVSDPGDRLVALVAARGLRVTVVPGPSAVLAALCVSGLPTERFCVEGFLPRRGAARSRRIAALRDEGRTTVVLEAPGRVASTLVDLAAVLGERPAALCRELTKVHEQVRRGTLGELAAGAEADPPRGECTIVIGGAAPVAVTDEAVRRVVVEALAGGATTRDAADAAASSLGVSRRRAYELALREATRRSG